MVIATLQKIPVKFTVQWTGNFVPVKRTVNYWPTKTGQWTVKVITLLRTVFFTGSERDFTVKCTDISQFFQCNFTVVLTIICRNQGIGEAAELTVIKRETSVILLLE